MNNAITFLLVVIGGLGILPGYTLMLPILGIGLLSINNKLTIPFGFKQYLLVIATVFVSFFWTKSSPTQLYSFVLLLSGGCFWIYARNFKLNVSGIFKYSLLVLTLIYYVLEKWGKGFINYLSVIYPSAIDHSHIGDLWSVGLPFVVLELFKGKRNWWSVLYVIVGLLVISQSLSRTAILSLGIGVILLAGLINENKLKLFTGITMLIMGIAFFLISVNKDTLFSRPYLIQSILGFFRYPFGVGLGNFAIVSQQFPIVWGSFSTLAHNLIAEMLSGLGFLSSLFIYWVAIMLERVRHYSKLAVVVLIVMAIQWMFDYTYALAIFVWLFFILLGSEERNLKLKIS